MRPWKDECAIAPIKKEDDSDPEDGIKREHSMSEAPRDDRRNNDDEERSNDTGDDEGSKSRYAQWTTWFWLHAQPITEDVETMTVRLKANGKEGEVILEKVPKDKENAFWKFDLAWKAFIFTLVRHTALHFGIKLLTTTPPSISGITPPPTPNIEQLEQEKASLTSNISALEAKHKDRLSKAEQERRKLNALVLGMQVETLNRDTEAKAFKIEKPQNSQGDLGVRVVALEGKIAKETKAKDDLAAQFAAQTAANKKAGKGQ
ncbi:hypothetical protein BCR34DRAFT_619685 [Clohesyomyces aquaticus]|uniref:Uncharacterized protein n=1 Tax=Clohesyomyces aquaticus TaxID=1231657 RepID=A0A1Y1YES8_9PLEO|nr:hypothetical protein BCR34DRAFT_619685 [Clohesyomyces aquaticus]